MKSLGAMALTLLCVSVLPLAGRSNGQDGEFWKGGQRGFFHDEGNTSGIFHTYDAFQVAGPNDQPRKIHVYVPRDYEENSTRYPVVYFNDGQTTFFPESWVKKTWHAQTTLDQLYAEGSVSKVIIVAVFALDRDVEYTHDTVPGHNCCGLPQYANYLSSYVKPWIDDNYRTLPDARHTTIVGSSHGGLAAFYTAAVFPQKFGNAGCLSSSFWVGLVPPQSLASSRLLTLAAPTLGSASLRPRVWIDWGEIHTGGMENTLIEAQAEARGREMIDLLEKRYSYRRGIDYQSFSDPQGSHEENSWARRLPDVFRFLLKPDNAQ